MGARCAALRSLAPGVGAEDAAVVGLDGAEEAAVVGLDGAGVDAGAGGNGAEDAFSPVLWSKVTYFFLDWDALVGLGSVS